MSDLKWTPGPWHYRPWPMDDWGWVRGDNGETIGHAHTGIEVDEANWHRAAKTDPFEANARLIAAAPELYEALFWVLPLANIAMEDHRQRRLAAGHRFGTKRVGLYDDEVDQMAWAESVLAKARGEMP